MDIYHQTLANYLAAIKDEGRYREFINIERYAQNPPYAFCKSTGRDVVLWCSNDYLGMGTKDIVKQAAINAIEKIRYWSPECIRARQCEKAHCL